MQRLFVYGTLKRGCKNHRHLAGQRYVGEARTAPGFRLYSLGDYPGMAADVLDHEGVAGEVWEVSADALARLDDFEGVDQGLYRRAPVPLLAPFSGPVDAYLYAGAVTGLAPLSSNWQE
ncbi:MAG: gamma-glutamylcyclotransferase [Verrucomicrobia bacterium]|nr:gamma-glutamylcyclotransferase [Verrucomicrobiota bacterium]